MLGFIGAMVGMLYADATGSSSPSSEVSSQAAFCIDACGQSAADRSQECNDEYKFFRWYIPPFEAPDLDDTCPAGCILLAKYDPNCLTALQIWWMLAVNTERRQGLCQGSPVCDKSSSEPVDAAVCNVTTRCHPLSDYDEF